MSSISLKCPSCGADLTVDENRKECFCTYCGSKILITNDNEYTVNINKNINITNRNIDDADIIRAKTEDYVAKGQINSDNIIKVVNNIPMPVIAIGLYALSALFSQFQATARLAGGLSLAGFIAMITAISRHVTKRKERRMQHKEVIQQQKVEQEVQKIQYEQAIVQANSNPSPLTTIVYGILILAAFAIIGLWILKRY